MKDGFIKVAAATPEVRVADCVYNTGKIIGLINQAKNEGVKVLVLPELCVTSCTCQDLFLQKVLTDSAEEQAAKIVRAVPRGMVCFFGCPVSDRGKLYDCAIAASAGKILCIVPKSFNSDTLGFAESRWFSEAPAEDREIVFAGQQTVLSANTVLRADSVSELTIAVEIGTDTFAPVSSAAFSGASLIVSLGKRAAWAGEGARVMNSVCALSERLCCAYIYAEAGDGESTSDMVFLAGNFIAENGEVLSARSASEDRLLISEIDVCAIEHRRKTGGLCRSFAEEYAEIEFALEIEDTQLTRRYSKYPFLPVSGPDFDEECEQIIRLQATGLKRRLLHTKSKTAVIGLSGGLDSTLALIVTVRAFEMLERDPSAIIAVTMPCFGTTGRTRGNAERLAEEYGCTLKVVDIRDSVMQHFLDIGHSPYDTDTVYENSQARERTQVLMDIANGENGLVIGTGDLSELALGWATYNGDHMCNYGVNAGVPKTLVRALVTSVASRESGILSDILNDIVDTPVSPELLPVGDEEQNSQSTENIVGPYALHDFFIYHMLYLGEKPSKIYRLACYVFADSFTTQEVGKWLKVFCRRFFTQQFKRSCLPDGPKVGPVSLSPRCAFMMPSDAAMAIWMDDLEDVF